MKHLLPYGVACTLTLGMSYAYANDEPESEKQNTKSKSQNSTMEETLVVGSRHSNYTEITQEAQKLVDMPGALGDPLSAIYSLPGVVYSEGDAGAPAVRGSSPEDNLYIVDFMPAGYVFHEFSNSIFHESIIQNFDLYSAGFGPRYGDVTGAVFDISLRDPENKDLEVTVDASMLRSGIFLEGGVTENSAFYLSGRKSLIHLFIPSGEEEDGVKLDKVPEDDDYQFKYTWNVNDKNKLSLSANGASDKAKASFSRESEFVRSNPDFEGDASLTHTYSGQNLIWDYYGENLSHLKVGFGHMDDEQDVDWGKDFFNRIKFSQDAAKAQYYFPLTDWYHVTLGASHIEYDVSYEVDEILFICTEFDSDCNLSRRGRIQDKRSINLKENNFYINNSWMITDNFDIDLGWQWQSYDYTDESFSNPRLSMRYQISDAWVLKSSAGRYNRFADVELVLPKVGNPDLKSPTADHYTIGVENELDNGWSWNLEAYYKELKDLPLAIGEDEADAEKLYANDVEGEAYGLDLFINKEITTNWYSWLSLSYAKSNRTNLRTKETKDYYLDTPFILNWVMNYQVSPKLNAGLRWTVRSGSAYTPIIGVQENPYFDDAVLPVYGDPFSDNLPVYSRLDLRFKWAVQIWNRDADVILDIINALNQQNVTEKALDYDKVTSVDDPVATEDSVGQGLIPALGIRMKF